MSRSKHKSSSDVANTAKRQAVTMETKVKIIERVERGEKMVDIPRSVTEESKRFMTQEMARGFSLFEEALVRF